MVSVLSNGQEVPDRIEDPLARSPSRYRANTSVAFMARWYMTTCVRMCVCFSFLILHKQVNKHNISRKRKQTETVITCARSPWRCSSVSKAAPAPGSSNHDTQRDDKLEIMFSSFFRRVLFCSLSSSLKVTRVVCAMATSSLDLPCSKNQLHWGNYKWDVYIHVYIRGAVDRTMRSHTNIHK